MAAFLIWNVGGKSGRNFDLLVQSLVRQHTIDVLLLIEYYPSVSSSTLSTLLLNDGLVRRPSAERFGVFARADYGRHRLPASDGGADLPDQDEYEVRVYDTRYGRRLVAAVEIVSPANKDRPESRRLFVTQCVALLRQHVCVALVDPVTIRRANL